MNKPSVKYSVKRHTLVITLLISVFSSLAMATQQPSASHTYLNQLIAGQPLQSGFPSSTTHSQHPQPSANKKPSAENKEPSANKAPSANKKSALSASQQLHQALNQLLQQLDTQLSQGKHLQSLQADYQTFKAKHALYLAHLQTVRDTITQQQLSSHYQTRLDNAQHHYTTTVQALLTQLDAYYVNQQQDPSLFDELTQKWQLFQLHRQLKQLQTHAALPKPATLRYSNLPYQSLKLAATEPVTSPVVVPSYRSPNPPASVAADLQTKAIAKTVAEQAKELNYDPIKIYQFVYTQIETQWYAGLMKGARGTLEQKSGNSVDQAALLVDLYRASNIPARFITGVIHLPAQKLTELIGSSDTTQAVIALKRAGIPVKTRIEGGQINAVELQHTWVSAYVPYANYRGATVDASGQTWLALMPAIKQYNLTDRAGVLAEMGLDVNALQQQYLQQIQTSSVLDTLESRIRRYLADNQQEQSYDTIINRHQLATEDSGYLPNSLPVDVIAVTAESSELATDAVHKVRFYALDSTDAVILDTTIPAHQIASQHISLSYQAATQADQNLLLSMGGINNVPLYLLDVTPQIKLQGRPISVGRLPMPAGTPHRFMVDLISPTGTYSVEKNVIAGNYHAIGIAAQHATLEAAEQAEQRSYESRAGKILSQVALRYINQWTQSEDTLAKQAGRIIVRPLPTVVFAGNDVNVASLLGQPQQLNWRGVNVDAALRITESLPAHPTSLSEQHFITLAALQGSWLEHGIFENLFDVSSISADKGIAVAHQDGIQVQQFTLNNFDPQLLNAHLPDVVQQIQDWVNLGYQVTIPQTPILYKDWAGSVWLVEDTATKQAGYFIARDVRGGATADPLPEELADLLQNPDQQHINNDPNSAAVIHLLPETDHQITAAGHQSDKLAVIITDENGYPVNNAVVKFNVSSGQGELNKDSQSGVELVVLTNSSGFASLRYRAPQKMDQSEIYRYIVTEQNPNGIKSAVSHIGIQVIRGVQTPLTSTEFFTHYTVPGNPAKIQDQPDKADFTWGVERSAYLYRRLIVTDQFDNPVSGVPVNLVAENGIRVQYRQDKFFDDFEVLHRHKLYGKACRKTPYHADIFSPCGVSQEQDITDVHGEIYLGVILGDVQAYSGRDQSREKDDHTGAFYPYSATVEGLAPLRLDIRGADFTYYDVYQTPRYRSLGRYYAATEPGKPYNGDTSIGIYLQNQTAPAAPDTDYPVGYEVAEAQSANVIRDTLSYGADFTGNHELLIRNMLVGDSAGFYYPKATWKYSATLGEQFGEREGERITQTTSHRAPGIAVVVVDKLTIPPIELGHDLNYAEFDTITYSAQPKEYTPYTVTLALYEDNILIQTAEAKPTTNNIMDGEFVLSPITMNPTSHYSAQVIFNEGNQQNEVRSELIDIDVRGPVIGSVGGGGAYIIDNLNDQNCQIQEPKFTLELFQQAEVTITTKRGNFRFISDKTLEAGTHQFTVNDIGFISAFLTPGKTPYTVTATSTDDGNTETVTGYFHFDIDQVNNLPVGSPNYQNVNLFNGSLAFSHTDIRLPGRGPEIELKRSYSSQQTSETAFGKGWRHNYDSYLQENLCGWVVVSGGDASGISFLPQQDGSYKAGKGFHGSLKRVNTGWNYTTKGGVLYHYSKIFPINNQAIPVRPRYYLDYIQDPNGNRTSLGYSATRQTYPQLELIEDSSGRQIKLGYTPFSEINIEQNDDAQSVPASFIFQANRNLLTHISGLGYDIRYHYDQYGRLIKASQSDGTDHLISDSYRYRDETTFINDDTGLVDQSRYIALAAHTNPRNITTEYSYSPYTPQTLLCFDGQCNATEAIALSRLAVSQIHTESDTDKLSTLTYTPRSRLDQAITATVTDPIGAVYTYKTDRYGRELSTAGPRGLRQKSWAANDTLMLSSTDENGVTILYDYDQHGNLIQEEVAGLTLSRRYTTRKNDTIKNLLASQTDRNGHTTEYDYDDNGNLTQINYPSRPNCTRCKETFHYLANGDRSQFFDKRGHRTRYLYDDYGNIISTYHPIGQTRASYDQRSRKVSETDENDHTTVFEYDGFDRLIKQTNALGDSQQFEWDDNHNKTQHTDEAGRVRQWQYDDHDRLIQETVRGDGDHIRRHFSYDANDSRLSESDFRGNLTQMRYDQGNRLIETRYPANEQGQVKVVKLDYDSLSNVTRQQIEVGAIKQITHWDYDDLYRKIRQTDPEGGQQQYQYDGNGNLTQQIDQEGRVTEFVYDSHNLRIQQTEAVGRPEQRSQSWQFDENGNPRRHTNGRGHQDLRDYDERNRQVHRFDYQGNRQALDYDDVGNLIAEHDHYNNVTRFDYDALNRKVKQTDPLGFKTQWQYDAVGNPIKQTQPNGNEITRQYDFLNRVIAESDSVGAIHSQRWDDDGNRLSQTDARGHTTTWQYDALSQLTRQSQPENRVQRTEYDGFGNVHKQTDGNGHTTTTDYDKLNRKIRQTNANGDPRQWQYDKVGNKVSETDENGHTTTFEYDGLNRQIKRTDPQAANHGRDTLNHYDANDNLLKRTDKRGIVTEYVYDRLDRVIEEKRAGLVVLKNRYSEIGDLVGAEDAKGHKSAFEYNARHEMVLESRPEIAVTRFGYDSMGHRTHTIDPEGRVRRVAYDLRQRITHTTNGAGEVTRFEYDLANNQITKTLPLGNQWRYAYDGLNRHTQITDPDGHHTRYAYDAEANLTSQTDALGHQTQFAYDALNRLVTKTYPAIDGVSATITHTYDKNSNLASQTDANGQTQTHHYDALNRKIRTDYSAPLTPTGRDRAFCAYQYDGNNNLTESQETYHLNTGGTETRVETKVYDDFDRLYTHTDSFGKVLNFRYDVNGNRSQLQDSEGVVTHYTVDGLNRTRQVQSTQGVTHYHYDRSSLISQIHYPNNTTADYHYDRARRTTQITHHQHNALVSAYRYQFDDNGNRTEQRETNGGAEQTTAYHYDALNRLTEVVYDQHSADETTVRTTYDANYNRTGETHTAGQQTPVNKAYRYNARNQLISLIDQQNSAHTITYQFDGNGNQTHKTQSGEITVFNYDQHNDLRQVTQNSTIVGQYLYNQQGLRIEKQGERGLERNTYDGQSILEQANQSGQLAKFEYGANQLLSLKVPGEAAQFYLTDALGSVVSLTNQDGLVQARYQYDAWGNKRQQTGTSHNRFSFTGYEEDRETGLLHAKARPYDPDTGQFLSEDAWQGDQRIAPSLHRYLYAYQNPTVYIDPDGNAPYLASGEEFDEFGYQLYQEGKYVQSAAVTLGGAFYKVGTGLPSFGLFDRANQAITDNDNYRDAAKQFGAEVANTGKELAREYAKEGAVVATAGVVTKVACGRFKDACGAVADMANKAINKLDTDINLSRLSGKRKGGDNTTNITESSTKVEVSERSSNVGAIQAAPAPVVAQAGRVGVGKSSNIVEHEVQALRQIAANQRARINNPEVTHRRTEIAKKRVYLQTNTSKEEIAIGRLADTQVASKLGMRRLNDPDWTIDVNDAWIQGGIDARKKFYIASPMTRQNRYDFKANRPTVFGREIEQLESADYIRDGDYFVPPSVSK